MTTLTDLRKLAEAATERAISNHGGVTGCLTCLAPFYEQLSVGRVLAMLDVIEAAKAMRDAGVDLSGRCIEPPYMSEKAAVNEFIGIFDGPLQRDFDAALEKLNGE